jgi:hypothetical protein
MTVPFSSRFAKMHELMAVKYVNPANTLAELISPGFFPASTGWAIDDLVLLGGGDGKMLAWIAGHTDSRDNPRLVVLPVHTGALVSAPVEPDLGKPPVNPLKANPKAA